MKRNNEKSINKYLEKLTEKEFWRLFVDGNKQNNILEVEEASLGHLLWFYREPHGLHFLQKTALELFTNKLAADLTLDFLINVHSSAFPYIDYFKLIKNSTIAYNKKMSFGEISKISLIEPKLKKLNNLHKKLNETEDELLTIQKGLYGYSLIRNPVESEESFKKIYQALLNEYTHADKTITNIVDFNQTIELLHMFSDGNTRLAYIILNKELMRYGFDPVILPDPNFLDYTGEEGFQDVIEVGQKIFDLFCEKNIPYENSYTSDEIKKNIENINSSNSETNDLLLSMLNKLALDDKITITSYTSSAPSRQFGFLKYLSILKYFDLNVLKDLAEFWQTAINDQELINFLHNINNNFTSKAEYCLRVVEDFVKKEISKAEGYDLNSFYKFKDREFKQIFEPSMLLQLLKEEGGHIEDTNSCVKIWQKYAEKIVKLINGVISLDSTDPTAFADPLNCHKVFDDLLEKSNVVELNGLDSFVINEN